MNSEVKQGLSAIWIMLCVLMVGATVVLLNDAGWSWNGISASGDLKLAIGLAVPPTLTFGILIYAAATSQIHHLLDKCGWHTLNCNLIGENDKRGIASGD